MKPITDGVPASNFVAFSVFLGIAELTIRSMQIFFSHFEES